MKWYVIISSKYNRLQNLANQNRRNSYAESKKFQRVHVLKIESAISFSERYVKFEYPLRNIPECLDETGKKVLLLRPFPNIFINKRKDKNLYIIILVVFL